MKKYLFIALLGLYANPLHAAISFCGNGLCENIDEQRGYPQIYTAMYGIFKNGITQTLSLCDSDANFTKCDGNGIKYFGEIGVSDTNFNVTGMNVVDAKINPVNRNLEIINDYYTYVNGNRILCSTAKDVLTLQKGSVYLKAKDINCPYNMQFNSLSNHDYKIKLIDLDRKIIGLEYRIEDSVGADSLATGYAILSFENVPQIDFLAINDTIKNSYQNQNYNQSHSGMAGHVPVGRSVPLNYVGGNQNQQRQSSVEQQYQNQVNASGIGQTQSDQGQYSYKSNLPYPWGYYYAPGSNPKQKKQKETFEQTNPNSQKKYTVAPLPMNAVELDTSGNQVSASTTKAQAMPIKETIMVQPKPAKKVAPKAEPKDYLGVFNEETFNNSVPK